jgi:hypothetical protein
MKKGSQIMTQLQFNSRRLLLLLVATSALLYSGCETTPEKYTNPEAGFLVSRYHVEVKGNAKQTAAMNAYARVIAEERLRTLKEGDTLPALRRYQQKLKEPIEVSSEALDKEPSLTKSQRQVVGDWLRQNPTYCSFSGEKVSEIWQQELAQVDRQIRQLSEQLNATLVRAKQNAAAGKFEEAVQECQSALRIDSENAEAQTVFHDTYRNWAGIKCGRLLKDVGGIRDGVAARTKHYETDQLTEAVIQQCEADLNRALAQLDDFRVWSDQNPDCRQVAAERETELHQAETQLADLRGTAWAQRIWLWREQHHYWAAYQYFIGATGIKELDMGRDQKHRLLDHETSAIHQRLREAYERMLPEGMAFYIRNSARAAEGQGANGLSLVLCRMAQELRDYAETQQMQLSPDVETLRASLNLSLTKAQEALRTGLARQLIVKDFESRGDTGHELAARIYDDWLKRYPVAGPAETPVPFWLLEIKRNAEKTNTIDYVLGGTVSKCYTDTLATKELSAERIEIGLEPQEIPNPDPKQTKKTPTIFEQERWIYERRTSQHAKKASIRADISVSFGGKTIPCATIDEEFDGMHKQLSGVQLTDQDVEHHAITSKQKRSSNRWELSVDKLPPNKQAQLSSDREIEDALIDFAKDAVLTNLEELVARFPLNNLFRDGLRNDGDPVKAADQFGQCLEYCSQLATLDKNLTAKTGGSWLVWREAMGDRITDLKKAQWRTADPILTAKIENLWELTVAKAVEAADQMARDDSGP